MGRGRGEEEEKSQSTGGLTPVCRLGKEGGIDASSQRGGEGGWGGGEG